ncbi:MAG: hypothetical protein HDR24_02720 [Lachnospiraceae bacterium]|nr:hypothetical protein [Lachnospiraceae bacterium]
MSKTKTTNILKKRASSNNGDAVSSLFSDADYEFNQPAEQSEFDKIYKGKSSALDQVSIVTEYNKPKCEKTQYVVDKKRNFINDIEEELVVKPKKVRSWPVSTKQIPRGHDYPAIERTSVSRQEDGEKKDLALAIAEDFVKRVKLILVDDKIYFYNGEFYCALSEQMAGQMIFRFYHKEICRASSLQLVRNTVSLLRYCTVKQIDEFPINAQIIVFKNGTLEVNTGRFRPNSPEDVSSSALGIDYDFNCREMPYTKKFLETIADGDRDLLELMLQVIGYILSNDMKAKAFFYLEGVGDAGKSRFCDLIASFFPTSGPNKVARIALQDLGGKFALGNLVNAKLNISEDLPDSPLTSTTVSKIKMLSDANRLEAEAKYVQASSFKPMCKLLFASNHPLRIKEYDAAFINRVVYIPFLKSIPKHKQDKDILVKMQEELPALFNHAFAAYRRLVAGGYAWSGADKFKPEICVVSSGIPIDKELGLRRFVDSCCCFEEDYSIPTSELQEAYQLFCQKNKYAPIAGDRFSREIFALLPNTVARIKIGNQRRGFKGVKLK